MKKKTKNASKATAEIRVKRTDAASLNSRVFLASAQCLGERRNYLFAFGGEF